MFSTSTSAFDNLPPRPPTPPKDISRAIDDALDFLDDSNEVERLINNDTTGHAARPLAPDVTPSSSQGRSGNTTNSKRVDFSPNPHYHKIAAQGQLSSPAGQALKRSPSSRDAKPMKSILKHSNALPPTPEDIESRLTYFSPGIPGSFNKMFHSACQQLAGPSRSSKLDAYNALDGALRAYEDPPDVNIMISEMHLLAQFITRDMMWKGMDGKLDTQIISKALQLAFSIVNHKKLTDALDDHFRASLVERSIFVLEQKDMPKQLMKMHVALMSYQRFGSLVMTPGKVDKLVGSLQTIEDRCSGNSIVAGRLSVYSRLLHQCPTVMLSRITNWLPHVFHGVLSSIPEVRQKAIEAFGMGGFHLGTQSGATKALQAIFQNENEEAESYWSYFNLRLIEMMNDETVKVYVPQIWSAVIVWFRSKRIPLEKWSKFGAWLGIIQKCLNSSDMNVRYQALLAWNRLVFVMVPGVSERIATYSMLRKPIAIGLGKQSKDRHSKEMRSYTLDCFYNLLHYTLRPGQTLEDIDLAWQLTVEPVMVEIARAPSGRYEACCIIQGLLSANGGVWNPNAALEATAIRPTDLPRLEPRWVRSRLAKLLSVLEVVIVDGMRSSESAYARVATAWQSLMQSITQAGAQEVQITADLKQAMALLISMLRRVWTGCNLKSEGASANTWMERYFSLVNIMLDHLGRTHFTEEILATTDADEIEVAPTPSHRSNNQRSAPVSPMVVLVGQLFSPPKAISNFPALLSSSTVALLERFLASKSSTSSKLELLSHSLENWTWNGSADTTRQQMLTIVSQLAIETLVPERLASPGQTSQTPGYELRSCLEIFMTALRATNTTASTPGVDVFYDTLFNTARERAGDGGVVLALLEPLAEFILKDVIEPWSTKGLWTASLLVRTPIWPRTRQAMEQARRDLWGTGLAPHKTVLFDPYEHMYKLIQQMLVRGYDPHDDEDVSTLAILADFVKCALNFLQKAPISLLATALRKVQDGFVVWVEDKKRKTSDSADVTAMVLSAWSTVIELLRTLPGKDSNLVKALQPLLVAGFSSPHRSIVNDTIIFWNDTFGKEAILEYPADLASVLRARVVDAEIELPNFPHSEDDRVSASLPEFYATSSQVEGTSSRPIISIDIVPATRAALASPKHRSFSSYLASKSSPLRSPNNTLSPMRRSITKSGSATPKAKLRHNDSQIEFAPIESSPLPDNGESQMLTEHQKEVKARQLQDAHLFPEFSSSPMAQSTALPKHVPKLLDFSSRMNELDDSAQGTPTGLPYATAIPSDDPPSSPTPSSARAASQAPIGLNDVHDNEDLLEDPPSSPPQGPEEQPSHVPGIDLDQVDADGDGITIDATVVDDLPNTSMNVGLAKEVLADVPETQDGPPTGDMFSASEFPSDSILPTTQLQLEQDAAEQAALGHAQADVGEAIVQNDGHEADKITDSGAAAAKTLEITRVENSFVEPEVDEDPQSTGDDQSQSQSQTSDKTSKKRKRNTGTKLTSAKKRKPSPFKRMWSTIVGGTQEDEDEDIGEEIVVASSQLTSSPDVSRVEQTVFEQASSSQVEEHELIKAETAVAMPPPAKRKQGRPRKSESPALSQSQSEAVSQRSLKRRASTMSNESFASHLASTSFVGDTPAPVAKAAKRREGQDMRSRRASQDSTSSATTRRMAAAVVVTSPEQERSHGQTSRRSRYLAELDDSFEGHATPDKQLAAEEAAATSPSGRRILTPRSILARLWDTVRDIKTLALGGSEERELDNVLFELRREGHEAGRRGRGL